MKKVIVKYLGIILGTILPFLMFSCQADFEDAQDNEVGYDAKIAPIGKFVGKVCNGKQILSFPTLTALQQEHLSLYNQYQAGNEEEDVLINYENLKSFYSLRKKAEQMSEGIIPLDPTFEETNYTLDPILETLLNQDGMVIINNRLYMWDSGCIIYSLPFSCQNYLSLISFQQALLSNNTSLINSMYNGLHMSQTNICNDANFQLEESSENGGRVLLNPNLKKSFSGCGYEVVLNTTLVSCVDNLNVYKVSFESIAPINVSNTLNSFYLKSISGNLANVEYSASGILGGWVPINTNPDNEQIEGYLIPLQQEFYLKIPQAETGVFDITLLSSINNFTGNSCQDSDKKAIINSCPFSITAVKNYYDSNSSTWTFSISGGNGCPLPNGKVDWNFGDGTPVLVGNYTESHTFSIPCIPKEFNVTATIGGVVCGVSNKLFFKGIPLGDFCKLSNYTFPPKKDLTIDGKKVKLRAKLKQNVFGKSKFVNLFKGRAEGTKTIQALGNIYYPSADNSQCLSQPISNILSIKTTTGKKRNRQKVKLAGLYMINALDKYSVNFSHSTGLNHTLTADNLFCSQ